MRPGLVALVGWGRRQLTHPLPALLDEMPPFDLLVAKGAAPERCSRPMSPLADCNEGIRQPPRLTLKTNMPEAF